MRMAITATATSKARSQFPFLSAIFVIAQMGYLAEDFDENIVGLTDLKALGLFDGSVIPHYSRRDLKRYIKNSNQKDIGRYSELYSVDDNEALVAEDSKVKKVNFRKVKVKE